EDVVQERDDLVLPLHRPSPARAYPDSSNSAEHGGLLDWATRAASMEQQEPQSPPAPQARLISDTVRAPLAMIARMSLSETPRQTQVITRAPSLGDDLGLGRLGVVFADERIGPGLEGGHLELDRLAARDHLLDPRLEHVELLRALVLVGDDEDEGGPGLDL